MAPSLCSLVSEGIYDGQLHAHSSTANNGIELVEHDRDSIVHRSSGLQFVGHVSDPSKAGISPVEVALTKRIVNDLLGSPFRTARRSGTLTEEDILVVAPFNLQVSALASSLGRAFKVGTVDKFQGQEAPVVVVSMCGFDADADANSRRSLLLLHIPEIFPLYFPSFPPCLTHRIDTSLQHTQTKSHLLTPKSTFHLSSRCWFCAAKEPTQRRHLPSTMPRDRHWLGGTYALAHRKYGGHGVS